MSKGLPIFVINLDRATSRLDRISANFAKHNLKFERVRAIEPSDFTNEDKKRLSRPRFWGGELSDPEIACVASHLLVWQMVVDRGLPMACIMEDDAVVTESALDWLQPSAMPADSDILKLEGVGRIKTKVLALTLGDRNERRVVFPSLVSVGSACYIITLKGAKKALAKIPQLNGAIDTRMAKYWVTGLNLYEVHPFPVRQDGSPSFIKDEHLRVADIRNRKTFFRTIKKRIAGFWARTGRVSFQLRKLGLRFFDRVPAYQI